MKKTNGIPSETHALLNATVLTSVTTGAVAGAVGGPPGVVLGGTVGAALGVLIGGVLDDTMQASDRHDRELDEAIGVVGGDLGARDVIRAGNIIDRSGATASAASLLRAEHARLEEVYERLLRAYRAGDWSDVRAEWDRFEPALRAHMALEEAAIFPSFQEVDPEEAEHLLSEHTALRTRLDVLGVNIELHAVTSFDAEELIERLRSHRAREERLLYPWMDVDLDRDRERAPGAKS